MPPVNPPVNEFLKLVPDHLIIELMRGKLQDGEMCKNVNFGHSAFLIPSDLITTYLQYSCTT